VATPVGHLLGGHIAYRLTGAVMPGTGHGIRGLGLWCAFAAVAADLDFLPGILLGRPALHHQGASHSFLAAALVSGILAAVAARGRRGFAGAWLALFLAYSSHLALDLVGPDRRPPYGIPLLWPLSPDTFLSPVTLLPGVSHAGRTGVETGEWISRVLRPQNAVAVLWEIAALGPLAFLLERVVRARRPGPER
jgi:inner membrane protein